MENVPINEGMGDVRKVKCSKMHSGQMHRFKTVATFVGTNATNVHQKTVLFIKIYERIPCFLIYICFSEHCQWLREIYGFYVKVEPRSRGEV
jgi:hypothetical protein